MKTSYLLDTSVLVLNLREDPETRRRLDEISAYASAISLGELYYGAENSIHVEKSIDEIDDMAQTISILNTNRDTAVIYGQLKHKQQLKGRMIPDNDLWIAATAIQYGLPLAARDNHFTWIAGLTLEQW
jgi:tRNA(fMet)-specific endonuclease VapC